MKAAETTGDAITHDLIVLLDAQYLTPFDREDVYLLATEIDDIMRLPGGGVRPARPLWRRGCPPATRFEQSGIIVKAVEQLSIILVRRNLKGMKGIYGGRCSS